MKKVILCCWLIGVTGYSAEFVPVYQSADSVCGKDIPGLKLRTPEFAGYCAIQFGPGPQDVLQLVLDCKRKMGPHDVLGLYIAGHEVYGKSVILGGRKKDDKMLSFKKVKFTTVFGDIEMMYDAIFNVRTLWDKQEIDLKYEIACRARNKATGRTYRFVLYGNLDPIMNADRACVVKRLIEKPFLNVSWDHRSDPPHIRCRILAGPSTLEPQSGFNSRADINISVKGGKGALLRKVFRIKPDGERKEFTYRPRKRLKPRIYYITVVTVDLAPLFDVLRGESVMALR
ncbi:MAG: hypothetical protein KAH23_03825 [Kiritimatiellae bacterium]|nr:hypothetical protein [Kiritimatiellia bacterium]